jgi:hypothetical protein
MAHRDPETGQFVSGGGAMHGQQYHDFTWQHYRGTFRDNDTGPNARYSLADIAVLEPAGGLDRNVEAELVALLVHNVRAEIDEAEVTDGDGIRAGFELSRDGDLGPLGGYRTEVDLSDNAFEDDTYSPTDAALSRQIITEDPDVLWFTMIRGEAGGGGRVNATHGPEHTHYRRDFGEGPLFRRGDELHLHGRQNSVARASNWVADIQFTACWDVHELEDARRSR